MTPPNSVQSAEEPPDGVQSELFSEWKNLQASFSERLCAESSPFPSPTFVKWLEDLVYSLRLTNQSLKETVERLEGEAVDLLKMKERWAKVEEAYESDIATLRARVEDMKELEQALMLKESHIKELEAEVERMKKENLSLGDAVVDKSVELAQIRERLQFAFVDILGWYQHEATVSLTLTAEKVVELYHRFRLRELSSREQSRSTDERAGEIP